MVDVDAGQPIADRPVDERRGDGRIDAARQGADDLAVGAGLAGMAVDPFADPRDGRLDEVRRRPRRFDAGDALDEVAQHVLAPRRVRDLGVELDPVQIAVRGFETRERRGVGLGGGDEALRAGA